MIAKQGSARKLPNATKIAFSPQNGPNHSRGGKIEDLVGGARIPWARRSPTGVVEFFGERGDLGRGRGRAGAFEHTQTRGHRPHKSDAITDPGRCDWAPDWTRSATMRSVQPER